MMHALTYNLSPIKTLFFFYLLGTVLTDTLKERLWIPVCVKAHLDVAVIARQVVDWCVVHWLVFPPSQRLTVSSAKAAQVKSTREFVNFKNQHMRRQRGKVISYVYMDTNNSKVMLQVNTSIGRNRFGKKYSQRGVIYDDHYSERRPCSHLLSQSGNISTVWPVSAFAAATIFQQNKIWGAQVVHKPRMCR